MTRLAAITAQLPRQIARALRREDGNATVEAVLWFPFFMAAFTLVIDATLILHNHSIISRVLQDGTRALSTGKFSSEDQAEDYIEQALASVSGNALAQVAIVDGIISSTVSVPAADLDFSGMFAGLSGATIRVHAQHLLEL